MSKLFKIGDISKLCNISIKTLRYYEEMGLIKPVEVDIYSGYRYYDEKNVQDIYKIQFLKELDMPLKDIRDFDDTSLAKRMKEIKQEMKRLTKQKTLIDSLINLKGEKIMKPFINDEQAIGRWKYLASALSKESYLAGDMVEDSDLLFKEIYFLPNGEGYWVFDRWSKGEIYHFRGVVYTYEIEDDKLYLSIYNVETNEFEIVCVYEKADSKEYTKDEIRRKDNIDLPFINDEKAIGHWKSVGWTSIENKRKFSADSIVKSIDLTDDYPLQSLTFNPNGELLFEFGKEINKHKWTKNSVLSIHSSYNMDYKIVEINGKQLMLMDWKSGDYGFGGDIYGCYILEKQ